MIRNFRSTPTTDYRLPRSSGRRKTVDGRQSGQILALVVIVVAVVLVSTLLVIGGSQIYFQNSLYSLEVEKATALAEAGVDKAIESLNKTGGNYAGETEKFLGDGSYSVVVTNKDSTTKIVEATGYIPNQVDPKVTRKIRIEAIRGIGVAFVYGVQIGSGGFELGNSNVINGSVYSNGNIIAGNSNEITGDAWIAGGVQPNPDQETDCTTCSDFEFGKTVSGEVRLDVAQSFRPSVTALLNKVSIKIKKFGNPPDLPARILSDDQGKPDKNGVLATGTLYSSLVTSDYGWIDITFSSSPNLTADTTYWLLIDSSSDANNFWSWQNDLAQNYTRGAPNWSPNWATGNPTWSSFAGDLSFKTFIGGTPTIISGHTNFNVGGNVHANTIENLTISGDAYYQSITGSTVGGTSYPNSEDPPPKVFPISNANVTEWKNQASGSALAIPTCGSTWGPGKYTGDILIDSNCSITLKTPIWITGNLSLNSNNQLILSSEYGTTSGVIVVDGTIILGTNNDLVGSGIGSSVLMALTTYDSKTNDLAAIAIGNNGNSGVFYANDGIIEPGSNNDYKELTAWKIRIINASTINYETGLSSTIFSSGPSGSYSLVKGTYHIK